MKRLIIFFTLFLIVSSIEAKPYFWELEGGSNPVDLVERQDYRLGNLILADLDGDNDMDLIIPGRRDYPNSPTQYYRFFKNTGTVTNAIFSEQVGNNNPLDQIERQDYRLGNLMLADLDGDNDMDLIIPGRRDYPNSPTQYYRFFKNTGTVTNAIFSEQVGNNSPLDQIERQDYRLGNLMLADLDGDNDMDLVVPGRRDYPNSPTQYFRIFQDNRNNPSHFINTYPKGSNATLDGFTINIQLNKPGKAYYIVVDNESSVPSVAEVKAGTAAGSLAALASGTVNVNEEQKTYVAIISGLIESTDYDIYVVAEDNEDPIHIQPTVTKLDYFTASEPTNILLLPAEIVENTITGTTIGLFTSEDRGSNTHTYTLVAGESATDNAAFAISGNSLQSAHVFDYETMSLYNIRVRTTDQTGLFFEKPFEISVTDIDEISPVFESGFPKISNITQETAQIRVKMNELGKMFYVVLPADVTAPSVQQIINHQDGNGSSAQVSGVMEIERAAPTITSTTLALSHSTHYIAYLVAQDNQAIPNLQTVVTAIEFSMPFTPTAINLSSASILELNYAGETIGALSATDEDSNEHVFELVTGSGDNDNANFSIVGNTLKFESVSDYEAQKQYSVRIRSTDDKGLYAEQVLTIDVTDVDDMPPVFENNYPVVENITSSSLDLSVKINESGKIYIAILAADAVEPSLEEMVSGITQSTAWLGYQVVEVTDTTIVYTVSFTELTHSSMYKLVLFAEDDSINNNQQITLTTYLTKTFGPPKFIEEYPKVSVGDDNVFKLEVKVDRVGTVFYAVVEEGESAPTIDDIISTKELKRDFIDSGQVNVTDIKELLVAEIKNLDVNKSYDLYLFAEDDGVTPLAQHEVSKIDFSLSPSVPVLVSPLNGSETIALDTVFQWKPSTDPNGDEISYELYVCITESFDDCDPQNMTPSLIALNISLIGFLPAALAFILSPRRENRLKIKHAVFILIAFSLLTSCDQNKKSDEKDADKIIVDTNISQSTKQSMLQTETIYYWKVVAKDGKGGVTESEVWSFTTQ